MKWWQLRVRGAMLAIRVTSRRGFGRKSGRVFISWVKDYRVHCSAMLERINDHELQRQYNQTAMDLLCNPSARPQMK